MSHAKYKQELLGILTKIKSTSLMEAFLVDLLTPAEWREVILRWQIIKELTRGTTQRVTAKKLGVSIAKITRGSRELLDKNGGFYKVLKIKK